MKVYRWFVRFFTDHTNFFRVHLLVFAVMSLIGAVVIWAIEEREKDYIDCLILSVTAFWYAEVC